MPLSKVIPIYPITTTSNDEPDIVISPSNISNDESKFRNNRPMIDDSKDSAVCHPNLQCTMNPTNVIPAPTSFIETNYDRDDVVAEEIHEKKIIQLQAQGYTTGLINALLKSVDKFYQRFWIVDNSGSMQIADGHRIVETEKQSDFRMVSCTRWAEIQMTVEYHVQMAGLLRAPTTFRLLNDPGLGKGCQEFSVCQRGENMIEHDIQEARRIMEQSQPGGTTPLARHIREIRNHVKDMESFLIQIGKKVAIIIATDGLPSDEMGISSDSIKRDFIDAITSLVSLPVWLVIRLCTDDDSVVDFYNDLDSQVEMPIEVLDDFVSEAKEVHNHNKWVTYNLPLHRCREMGYYHPVLDILDERNLVKSELMSYCQIVFGSEYFDGVPDPDEEWKGFLKSVKGMLMKEEYQYNPVKRNMRPVIDIGKLKRDYRGRGCFFSR